MMRESKCSNPGGSASCAAADNKKIAIGHSSQSLFIEFLPLSNSA